MNFLKKLLTYWFILLIIGFLAWFCAFNTEMIFVHVPQMGEFKMRAAIVYIILFLAGCLFSSAYFGAEMVRRYFEIRTLKKRVTLLESSSYAGSSAKHRSALQEPAKDGAVARQPSSAET